MFAGFTKVYGPKTRPVEAFASFTEENSIGHLIKVRKKNLIKFLLNLVSILILLIFSFFIDLTKQIQRLILPFSNTLKFICFH